ncbi:MAG: thiolase family protein [Acidobacteriia bacterium]|nr:thiolase family protein [Terriglobia bacterium]
MEDVYIVGIYSTPTGKFFEKSPKELVRTAYLGALQDAGLDGSAIGHIWFSNMMLDFWGQPNVKGQVCLMPLVEEGVLPVGVATTNVEAACASASLAFNGAWKDILSGQCQLSLAIGVEKMYDPTRKAEFFVRLEKGTDFLDPQAWIDLYQRMAAGCGGRFEQAPDRSIAMDIYALWAKTHMAKYGTTARQIAHAAAKNHTNSVGNPRAQYRFPMDVDAVLGDRMIVEPLTRAMCAPIGDAAAAALICSGSYLRGLPTEVRRRAVKVCGHAVASGRMEASWEDERAPVRAARRAYQMAGIGPAALDVIELHDATSFAEIHMVEDLGLCPRGHGGPFTASGATARDGKIPVNPSGGLVSRGHPIGATGLMMLNELCLQLRGEAGDIQVPKAPRMGLAENGGGLIGNDFAACAVTILEKAN